MPWNADVVRAYARRSLAIDIRRGNEYTFAIMQAARSLFGDMIEDRLSEWLNQHAEAVKGPINVELNRVSGELEKTHDHIYMARRSERVSRVREDILLMRPQAPGYYWLL